MTPKLPLFRLALTVAAAIFLTTVTASAEVVYPPGGRIGIELPESMRLDPATGRFEDVSRKATLILIDLPLPNYADIEKMVFTQINQPGVTLLKRESFPFNSGIGYFISVKLTVDGVVWRRWLLLAAAAAAPMSDFAALVTFQVPESESGIYTGDIVRKAFATVTFRPPPIEERLNLQPFKVSDYADFKLGEITPQGISLIEESGSGRMFISVGAGGGDELGDRAAFAREIVRTVPLSGMTILSEESMRIRGASGYEIKASAKSPTGTDFKLVQWLRFGAGGYLMVLGVSAAQDWDALYPRFRTVRDSIDPK
jgi:hypothetical protein